MKKIIVANWKMYPTTLRDAKTLLEGYRKYGAVFKQANVVICPPHIFAAPFAKIIQTLGKLGVQNIGAAKEGAHTGEVSALMCQSINAVYCIIGHSERRAMGETDAIINQKVIQALNAGLTPILAVGESEKSDDAHTVLDLQVRAALRSVPSAKVKKLIIAYEPRWAISKGKGDRRGASDTSEHAIEKMIYIRRVVAKLYSPAIARKLPILYGGSVRAKNVALFVKQDYGFNGALVGGASLDAHEFAGLIAASTE